MTSSLPDFSGKLVSVSFSGADDSCSLANPHWETQGDRLFLVGTVPPGGSTRDWCKGIVSAVAWDQVSDYIVFDSIEDYQARLRIYNKSKRKA